MKIPTSSIPEAYKLSKQVYNNELKIKDAVSILVEEYGMNSNSANDYIRNFQHMMNGSVFHRTLNTASMEYYINHIYNDYGSNNLSIALEALKKHINYYEGIHNNNVRMNNMHRIYEKYLPMSMNNETDEIEEEIIEKVVKTQAREDVVSTLINLKESDPELITVFHQTYKRDSFTIAQIKFIRDYKCQICDKTIITKAGGKYVEAAHITSKRDKGREVPENIILLCPNHHKEFDLGDRRVLQQNKSEIKFLLNGIEHKINLRIE